ncbi:SH3 domain-containing protein [Floridanema evergladense]|uniref:SH3 domain-containing protein n=1 Tax=Floridaenema evergladense BLCC-F167 TaxID=3153639 RepID=A0ABV4WHH9_9CYAN
MKIPLLTNLLLGLVVGWQNPNLFLVSQTAPTLLHKQVTSNQKACQIYAYVIDKDPQGLNVRANPNTSGEILGKLPTNTDGVLVDVIASQGNWVAINKAEDASGKVIFQGKGWVYAAKLGTSTRGYEKKKVSVYSRPDGGRKEIGTIPSNTAVTLLGCQGKWAFVGYQRVQGWLAVNDQCGNPLTTCS